MTATVSTNQADAVTDDQVVESTQQENHTEGSCNQPVYVFNLLIKEEEEDDLTCKDESM